MKLFTEEQVNELLAKQRQADTAWVRNRTGIIFIFRPIKLIDPFKIVCFRCHGDLQEIRNGKSRKMVTACMGCQIYYDKGKWRKVGGRETVDMQS